MRRKRKPEAEVIIRSVGGSTLLLRKSHIEQFDGNSLWRYATKASVRATLRGAYHTRVFYPDADYDDFTNTEPRGKSLGCLVFRGANLAKLRKWAGVK